MKVIKTTKDTAHMSLARLARVRLNIALETWFSDIC